MLRLNCWNGTDGTCENLIKCPKGDIELKWHFEPVQGEEEVLKDHQKVLTKLSNIKDDKG